MPITLPQLSRRAFLKRAMLAGAAMAMAPAAHAGWFGRHRDRHTFAFFSDTHVAGDPATVHAGVNMADNFAACIRELAAWPTAPAAVIVNGDLAFANGQAADYTTFGEKLLPARALAPVHLLLGNHDQRAQFWSAFPKDATTLEAVPRKQASVFHSDRANWFLLDSLAVTAHTPGELGAAQLEWLSRELSVRKDKPAIIVGHHPLDLTGKFGLAGTDSVALEDLFARHRQVKAFIFGHTHNWSVLQHASGVHLINLPPTGYVFAEGHPNGWTRVSLQRDGMELELRALDTHHPEHAQVQKLAWRV